MINLITRLSTNMNCSATSIPENSLLKPKPDESSPQWCPNLEVPRRSSLPQKGPRFRHPPPKQAVINTNYPGAKRYQRPVKLRRRSRWMGLCMFQYQNARQPQATTATAIRPGGASPLQGLDLGSRKTSQSDRPKSESCIYLLIPALLRSRNQKSQKQSWLRQRHLPA